jgi:hypothetical protein
MPCGICRGSGHNARTCQLKSGDLSDQPDFVPVGRWFEDRDGNAGRWMEDEDGNARRWFEEPDPDADFDEFIKLMDPALNFESHLIKSLEDEVAREQLECIICYETVGNEKVSIKCGHTYCVGCFVKHMRLNNECAYCRTELCEVPQNKRRMNPETRSNLIEEALNDDAGACQALKTDFIRQMRDSITAQIVENAPRNSRSATAITEICAKAVAAVDITFASWVVGLHTSNYISDWYER